MVKPSAFLAICLIATAVPNACHAGWQHRHGCGSCGSAPHRWHGSHGSSGGSHGGSSGGSAGGAVAPAPKPAAPAGKASTRVPSTGALLVVHVPSAANVIINGQRTNLTGAVREFVASGLAEDGRHEYEVTMTVDEAGTRREVTKTVWLTAGTEQTLAFDGERTVAAEATNATTDLTLTVPADAEVWIEGQRTSPSGTVRRFSTTQLARGESWGGYEIRVVTGSGDAERETVRTITLTGGETVELSISPESPAPGIETTAAVR